MARKFADDIRRAAVPLARMFGSISSSMAVGPFSLGRTWGLPNEDIDFHYAYKLIPTIQFCVNMYQTTISSTPLCFYSGQGDTKNEIERQPGNIVDLWTRGNSEDTGIDLVEQIVGSMQLQGIAYLYKDYMGKSLPQQFWVLNPILVRPIMSQNGRGVLEYQVRDGNTFIRVPKEQIVPFKRYDPELGVTGASRVGALRLMYETQRDSARFMRAFYKRGGTVAGHYSTDQALDPDEVDALKKDLRERVEGPEHAWEPVILPRKLKFERAGLTFAEMQFIESERLTTEQMLRLFHIHPILAAQAVAAGMNADIAGNAMMMFLRFGIFPECKRITHTINERLLAPGQFGRNLSCDFDFSNDPVLVDSWLKMAESWQKATGGPIATRAEARDKLGLPDRTDEFPTLDEPLIPIGMATEGDMVASPDPGKPGTVAEDQNPAPGSASGGEPDVNPDALSRKKRVAREALRVRGDRLLMIQERKFRAETLRIFRRQHKRVVAKLKAQESAFARVTTVDLNQLYLELDDPGDRLKAKRLIRAIVEDRGSQAIAELAQDLTYSMHAKNVVAFIESKAGQFIKNINATTRRELQEMLSEGVAAAETMAELVARVDEVFTDRRNNAETIARTETAPAYNFATLSAWKQSGVVASKEWLTAEDDAVRDAHAAADGQVVTIDDAFLVDGEQLEHPGDPSGSPGNIINCRCTLLPVVSQADKGRLPSPIAARLNGHAGGGVTVEEWLSASSRK